MKQDARKLDHKALEEMRIRAVEQVHSGVSPEDIIRFLGLSRATVYNWLANYREGGWDALKAKKIPGRPHSLSEQQKSQVFHWINGRDPRQYKFVSSLWTRKIIAKLIHRKFKIKMSVTTVGRLLAEIGMTPQKPIRRAYQRDPVAIDKWQKEKFPIIHKRTGGPDAEFFPHSSKLDGDHQKKHSQRENHLVFVDEAGFMLNPLVRKTWAPRGCTPAIKSFDSHARISVIGAMTISPKRSHCGFYFHLLNDNANFSGYSIVEFIKIVARKIRSPMILLWDAIPIHRSKPVINYVKRQRRIIVEPFPPYAPELNPVDMVWGYVKYDRLPNYSPPNLAELRKHVKSEFRRLQKQPKLLEALFSRTGLSLD